MIEFTESQLFFCHFAKADRLRH